MVDLGVAKLIGGRGSAACVIIGEGKVFASGVVDTGEVIG